MFSPWSSHWHHHNTWSLPLTASQIINLSLKLDGGQVSLSLEMIDYATFALIMQSKMRHTLCWNVPNITPLIQVSIIIWQGSLKSSFHLDQQVDIGLYLAEATTLCHSRELAGGLKISWCTFNLWASQTSRSNSFHCRCSTQLTGPKNCDAKFVLLLFSYLKWTLRPEVTSNLRT